MWAAALVLFLLSPGFMIIPNRNNPNAMKQLDIVSSYSPAAVERFGLFTIIVLGEVIVSVVLGVVGLHHINWPIGITAVLGMLVAIGLYWIYFDYISHRLPVKGLKSNFSWVYLHLPMTIGIAAAGAGVLNAVEHTDKSLPTEARWVLVGTVALVLISMAILMRIIKVVSGAGKYYRRGSLVVTIMGIVIALLGLSRLPTIPLLAIIILLILIPAIYGIMVWVKVFGGVELGEEQ
jgi:low temperature requirement protein LtrA